EHVEPLDCNDPEYLFLITVLYRLLSGFRSTTRCQLSPSENGGGSVTPASTTAIRDTSRQCRKRIRVQEDDNDDDGQNGFLRPPPKRINLGQGKVFQRSLACPYLKLDPIKHGNC